MSIQDIASSDKLVWWIIGVLTLVAGFVISSTVEKVDRCETRIGTLERSESTSQYQMRQLDTLLNTTRTEQIERTRTLGEIKEALALMKMAQENFTTRLNTMSQRILSINRRLNGGKDTGDID